MLFITLLSIPHHRWVAICGCWDGHNCMTLMCLFVTNKLYNYGTCNVLMINCAIMAIYVVHWLNMTNFCVATFSNCSQEGSFNIYIHWYVCNISNFHWFTSFRMYHDRLKDLVFLNIRNSFKDGITNATMCVGLSVHIFVHFWGLLGNPVILWI